MQNIRKNKAPVYKYKIGAIIDKLPKDKHSLLLDVFTQEIGSHITTLYNWKKIEFSSKYSIPSEKLDRLAKLLGLESADELKNYDTKQVRSLDKITPKQPETKFGLSKTKKTQQ